MENVTEDVTENIDIELEMQSLNNIIKYYREKYEKSAKKLEELTIKYELLQRKERKNRISAFFTMIDSKRKF